MTHLVLQAAQVIQAPASRAPAPSYSIDSANTFVDKNFSTGKGVPSPIAQVNVLCISWSLYCFWLKQQKKKKLRKTI